MNCSKKKERLCQEAEARQSKYITYNHIIPTKMSDKN